MDTDYSIMNSCPYTPVYFIESPGVTQNMQSPQKPISENLKRFYENSGKMETNLNHTENNSKPRILKKQECNVVGNNLKLASFLLPKSEVKTQTKQNNTTTANNVILKPIYIANGASVAASVPKLDINSRIVKLKDLPNITRSHNGRILPKIKPKEKCNKSRHTSVQLLKLGETYHSLNRLSDDQMKIVNHALQIFHNPQNAPPEPTYDPVTNTKYIYKVVSPKDLAVVGKNKELLLEKKPEIKKEIIINNEIEAESEDDHKINLETKVTRSGRIVKLPKNILLEEVPNKTKKKNVTSVTCLQCSSKFGSPQRLNRHYEYHPSHLPSRLHNDLFQCLLAIVQGSPEEKRPETFLQQLEYLIEKLKHLAPCLTKTDDKLNLKSNKINEDVSRLLGVSPGDYKLNIDALNCKRDNNGHCDHNPPPQQTKLIQTHVDIEDIIKATIQPNEDKILDKSKIDTVKLIDKRQAMVKIENRKQKYEQSNHDNGGKKVKLTNEPQVGNLSMDEIVSLISETKPADNVLISNQQVRNDQVNNSKPSHIQFHSAHFDIRSSPIKSSSTVFRKFQINPEKMAKYEVQIVQPLKLNQLAQDLEQAIHNPVNETPTVFNGRSEQSQETTKKWPENESDFIRTNSLISNQSDDFMRSNASIEPALIHIKDTQTDNTLIDNNDLCINDDYSSSNGQALINFLESLGNELTSTEPTRSNPSDFQMDLFSFNNS
ncbi:unnamed protein product [Danaus chrysippus]|uniref:(African queen) hypothetical protein n=1 Tax=Danaus chrysippus TaxID=151541 RepID=A0A8J2QID1_9NEOP|nr:unnamed protein product [Danaus chrysippus]